MADTVAWEGDGISKSSDVVRRTNASIWVLITLATIFLGLRVFCKFRRHKGLWWDDWVLFPSWLVLLASGILITISLKKVFGSSVIAENDDFSPLRGISLLDLVAGTLFFLGSAWSKTSFALTLLRIAGTRLKLGLWFIIISMNALIAISVILRWVQCQPVRKVWDFYGTEGTCLDRNSILAVTYAAAAYSAFMDFVLALLPWPVISKLQMKTSEKIGVSVALSMGIFAGATAIVRCTKLQVLTGHDITRNVFDLAIWSVAETATTIMASTVPVLRALVRETTGVNGHLGCPVRYIRNLSREITSKARTHRGGSSVATVSAARWARSGCLTHENNRDSDSEILHAMDPAGRIMKMEEVHIQYGYKGDYDNDNNNNNDNMVFASNRADWNPRPWA
ncbi:hypothetical protein F4775DRAFT_595222 [Biscogniauxia sp. FL1348]|nr:hypothetical protein F4775DRAFT_595222 [Biscogniauxia sp. FL1348]